MTKAIGLLLCAVSLFGWVSKALAGHSNGGCSQCHIVHRPAGVGDPPDSGLTPLWSPQVTSDGLPTFTVYSSPTFDALHTDIGQPDGASKLCLGCHDGTSSEVGASANPNLQFSPTSLGVSHPISFTYDSSLAARVPNGGLRDPALSPSGLGGTIAQDLLDRNGKLQCTSCHDVHASGKGTGQLRYDYNPATGTDAAMCRTCHYK